MAVWQISRTAFLAVRLSRLWQAGLFEHQERGKKSGRPVAQLAEQRIPNPQVGGSIPSWPAISAEHAGVVNKADGGRGPGRGGD